MRTRPLRHARFKHVSTSRSKAGTCSVLPAACAADALLHAAASTSTPARAPASSHAPSSSAGAWGAQGAKAGQGRGRPGRARQVQRQAVVGEDNEEEDDVDAQVQQVGDELQVEHVRALALPAALQVAARAQTGQHHRVGSPDGMGLLPALGTRRVYAPAWQQLAQTGGHVE